MANDRPRIATTSMLAGATIALVAAFAGTYDAAHLRSRVLADSTPNALNTAYLEAWLRSAPRDPTYLKALGTQYLGFGRLDDAQRVATRLAALGTPDERREADDLLLRCDLTRAFAAEPRSSSREIDIAHAQALLKAMVPEAWTAAQLQWLANQALAVNAPATAARYDERLVAADPAHKLHWQREAARYDLATGAYREAASAYFVAQDMASTTDEARRDFIAALRALQAGSLLDDALTQGGAHIGALAKDRATLEVMLELARAANRPELVERYARALLPFVVQRAPEAGAIRLVAAHIASASPGTQHSVWLRLPGIDRFVSAPAHRAAGGIVEIDYASAQRPRLMRITASAPATADEPRQNDKLALTLYQSFLEANDLADAETVAAKQVQRAGSEPEWRKRLAQVQEWHNEPMAAMQSWLAYAKATDDPEGWRNVQRMAPMLHDDETYVQSLVHASDAEPANLSLVDGVIAAYERLGRPEDGLAFLKARAHGARTEDIERRYAWLSQRSGHFDTALTTYEALQQAVPRSTEYAERSANLLYQRGDYAGALAALKRVPLPESDADALYWRTYAQLARLLEDDADANVAYRHLLLSPGTTADDFTAMTFFYYPYPIDAARTATRNFRSTGDVQALHDALTYFVAAHALDEAGALLASLTPAQRAAAGRNPEFLAARAEYERQLSDTGAALADLRRAVAMPGTSNDTRAAYLWMAVDVGSVDEVRAALERWRDRSLEDETLWGPYAAGEMQLNRPEAALRYLRRQAAANQNDPLWLLTYADAQDMAGHTEQAWAVRRRVWLALLHETRDAGNPGAGKPGEGKPAKSLTTPARNEWEARQQLQARRALLAQEFTNGDAAARLLDALSAPGAKAPDDPSAASLLGNAKGVAPLPTPSERDAQYQRLRHAVARDVAVAWALSGERNEVARRWLARRYAADLAADRNERLTIALAEEDTRQVTRILDTHGAALSLYSRIDGERLADREGAAQAHAFAGLDGAPDDTQLHTRLVDTSLFWNQSIGASVESYVEHPLDYVQQTLAASLKLTDHYLIGLTARQRFQHSTDETQLTNVESVDRAAAFYLRRQTRDATVNAAFGRRDGLDSFYTFRLDGTTGKASSLTLTGSIARNAQADEVQTLLIGGMKDLATAGFAWQIDSRWSFNANVEADRFYSQARNFVGTGVVQQAEIDYKIRTDYPDYTLRLVGAHGGYKDSGHPDALLARLVPLGDAGPGVTAFMPNSYTQFALYAGFGNDLAERYTHAWRPYMDVGIVHDTVQGWGVDANLGIAGSVFGGDQAALYFQREQVAQNGTAVTLLGARYRWLY
ncbi:MAG: tetratricopeptide repeat protein [Paraburkholderia sp.]|uniref:tetratricopeptide repeat protein n=1 Tax=Paraburkholderia sp. TaxID=1926495 RepID=UPI0011F928FD|nr:tetratricopeptide repeat protein [Paraburkholderia sp.]TAM02593.1 MAG: tetratricopeptide repeat protein [Paraburkholderia sp.]TAM28683.1 MAG: tetratricopeptide repeat protein [Paraburkholderia sp.]